MYVQNIIKRGIVFTGVAMVWPMFIAMTTILLPNDLAAQVERVGHIKSVYTTGFWCLIFIAPSLIPLLRKLSLQLGLAYTTIVRVLLYVYAAAISFTYLNQIFFFPKLIKAFQTDYALRWYLGNPQSMLFLINQVAYGILGAVLIILFTKALNGNSYPKKIAITAFAAGCLFVTGALLGGLHLGGALYVTYSGLFLLIPFGFICTAYGMSEQKKQKP